ncbi:NAD(P)-dependent oxidoreductase [Nocardioides coralli]|nr:NAD(P)-dependent oxidoreductase [Nocardioides coralli]
MGGRVAEKVAAAGHDVVGFDPAPQARSRAAAAGTSVVDDAAAVVAGADVIVVSVPKPEHVAELAGGALLCGRPGTVVVDISTIDPATAREAAAGLARQEICYLDAPVLGRPAGCGSWTLVTGGPQDQVARVAPLLESTIAGRVVRIGDVGAGSVVKILNNLMFGAINAVTAEAIHLCSRAGIDPAVFVDAVVDSGAATVSNLFRDIGPRIAEGNHAPVFALDLLAKDNRLAADLASGAGAIAPLTELIGRINDAALALGHGADDTSAVIHAYDEQALR